MDPGTPQEEAKKGLLAKLATYTEEKIVFAGNMVVANACEKITDGDVLLTYAHSAVVLAILLAAKKVRPGLAAGCWEPEHIFGGGMQAPAALMPHCLAGVHGSVLDVSSFCCARCSLPSGAVLGHPQWQDPCPALLPGTCSLTEMHACPQEGKEFRVVVVDARPHMAGRKLLQQLLRAGIGASYCLLNALTYVMQVPPLCCCMSACWLQLVCSAALDSVMLLACYVHQSAARCRLWLRWAEQAGHA